uniref:Vascular endothelial growth factor isoform 1 n=1 Tax=Suta nigriceps TaxID=687874 RepID=H8PG92_9SAUR|nr:vascular endothelial growth factor isoform 1 [Parasuta nigriceps]
MNFLLTWIHCGLAALLYFHNAKVLQAAPAQEDAAKQPEEVIPFMTVFERSACRPIETMVDVYQEYPDEVEYLFKPSCVLLMKCGGFCNDEALECVPTEVHNISMEIMKLRHLQSQHIQRMSFQQHSKCQCRQKKPLRIKQEKMQNYLPIFHCYLPAGEQPVMMPSDGSSGNTQNNLLRVKLVHVK